MINQLKINRLIWLIKLILRNFEFYIQVKLCKRA